jgi:hypothetical protein
MVAPCPVSEALAGLELELELVTMLPVMELERANGGRGGKGSANIAARRDPPFDESLT